MNLIFDALNAQMDAAEQRMDDAGIPKIVRELCFNCGGVGAVSQREGALFRKVRCSFCGGAKVISREVA